MVFMCEKNSSYKDLIVNPTPKYFVTIKGNIEPHMPYPMTVMFRASYAAYNPKCAVKQGWLSASGLSAMPAKNVIYSAKPDKQGNYVIKIPIDAYQTGSCDWKIAWIMYAFKKKTSSFFFKRQKPLWGDMIRFGKKGVKNELPGFPIDTNATAFCGSDGRVNCLGAELSGWYRDSVPRHMSYQFIQNIQAKKEK